MFTQDRLRELLRSMGRVMLGYSGGVDSAVLAVVGAETLGPERFVAVIGTSASYPVAQYDQARELARRFRIPLLEVETHELEDPRYAANPTNRCYFCKTELWSRLGTLARERGFDQLIDGTNRDDLSEHRPGKAAGLEHSVRSPLAELGWTKAQVRAVAESLGLPTWNAPASPCLSSRVQYGLSVTPERLRQVELGEAFLRSLGVQGDLRVRHEGSRARIEVNPESFSLVRRHWSETVERLLALGFEAVELDPRGYRRGSLLTVLARA